MISLISLIMIAYQIYRVNEKTALLVIGLCVIVGAYVVFVFVMEIADWFRKKK